MHRPTGLPRFDNVSRSRANRNRVILLLVYIVVNVDVLIVSSQWTNESFIFDEYYIVNY